MANVGDSAAVACCDSLGRPLSLTTDHTPYDNVERKWVEVSGGFIGEYGVLRVNGSLAVTRSLGDRPLITLLRREPSITLLDISSEGTVAPRNYHSHDTIDLRIAKVLTSHEARHQQAVCSLGIAFLIVGSDGLWDVVHPFDAVMIVCEEIEKFGAATKSARDMHNDVFEQAAKALAAEAYVRGSMDNIGVCVVQLS